MTFGLDETAWSMWLNYRRSIKKPLKPASIELAQKRMAALGPMQREAVEYSIANGYQGLFQPRSAQKIVNKIHHEAIELTELTHRANKIGFRAPREGEDVVTYRMLLGRAEEQAYWNRRGLRSIAEMVKT